MAKPEHFGEELAELKFDGFLDWFIHIEDPRPHWDLEPTYLISQFAFLLGGICTFIHAIWSGGRMPFLWLGILLHGLVVEMAAYWIPDIDNFWHSQTPIMLLGRRLPLHIITLYPCFLYQASVAVSKLRLPRWAEPFAVGLTVVLIDIPYDIVSVKFAHWTWHDTDPNIYDRHYWVPWNSYYFHSCFAASFTFWFHGFRRWIKGSNDAEETKWNPKCWAYEMGTTILAGLLGMPGGVLLFLPLYHPLHDIFGIHSEVTYFILFSIFLAMAWSGDRKASPDAKPKVHFVGKSWILLFHLLVHYSSFLAMTIFFNPEDEVASGLHETIGPCDEHVPVQTAFGMVLQKRKYLCLEDYDEDYFDFHCVKKEPSNLSSWYTICGTPFRNRAEYIAIIGAICFLAFNVFRNMHFNAGNEVDGTKRINESQTSHRKKRA